MSWKQIKICDEWKDSPTPIVTLERKKGDQDGTSAHKPLSSFNGKWMEIWVSGFLNIPDHRYSVQLPSNLQEGSSILVEWFKD